MPHKIVRDRFALAGLHQGETRAIHVQVVVYGATAPVRTDRQWSGDSSGDIVAVEELCPLGVEGQVECCRAAGEVDAAAAFDRPAAFGRPGEAAEDQPRAVEPAVDLQTLDQGPSNGAFEPGSVRPDR